MSATRQLAEYFSGPLDQVQTPGLRHEMRRLLTDYVGVALAGSRTKSGEISARFVRTTGGAAEASLIGSTGRVPAAAAAFANAIAQHSVELDDIDELAYFHYAPPVMSAALAVAQTTGATGREFVTAALAGCEAMERLSRASNPSLRDRGFHTTPACGVFGAAVAAGRLLKLDAGQMASALGLAGAQAGGLMEMYGDSMQKRFNPGPASRNGVVAAQLAALGFTGADTILEGERGFGRALAGEFDVDSLLDDLGSTVPVAVEYKPYSCARPIHNAIDCALAVRTDLLGRLDEITKITVARHPSWAHFHGNTEPVNFHEAQMSLPYSVAVALVDGAALPSQYATERVQSDRVVQRLTRLVEITVDDSLARGVSCHLTAELADATAFESVVDFPRGSTQNPLTDDELIGKATMLGAPIVGEQAMAETVALINAIEDLPSVEPLLAVTSIARTESGAN